MTDSLAREHDDPHAGALPPLVVDRQRVVHAAAFRRLQQKTQVFVAPESDHFRTRLTHTLEVAHQARCIAAALGLDADLAEVVALAHDLGHPPFGHAGERALNECMREHGGFEHNLQTLRVVELLEHPYPEFLGLNLTRAVRHCLAGHSTPYDRPDAAGQPDKPSFNTYAPAAIPLPPESAVVDLADRVAYALHDLQDGLYAGLIEPDALADVALWRSAYAGPRGREAWRGHLRPAVDRIQQALLAGLEIGPRGKAPEQASAPALSSALEAQLAELDRFLFRHVYRSPQLVAADAQAREIIARVFAAYIAGPEQLPERFRRRVPEHGLHRVVADYVAGMTDRYCLQEHTRLADLPG